MASEARLVAKDEIIHGVELRFPLGWQITAALGRLWPGRFWAPIGNGRRSPASRAGEPTNDLSRKSRWTGSLPLDLGGCGQTAFERQEEQQTSPAC